MIVPNQTLLKNDYPTSDGKPMAETDFHRILMVALIQTLERWYALERMVYVSGNLLVFYERGNRRRHLSPDVFVVRGVAKHLRPNYLIWEEGRGPDMVIELTSSSTRHQDTKRRFLLYQDTLHVSEYFLFDPKGDYLLPRMQGYRLSRGKYVAIKTVDGRLPSKVLGLHLEEQGDELRLYDPATAQVLLTPVEAEGARAEQEKARAEQEKARAEQEKARADHSERENQRLREEIEVLRRRAAPER